MKPGAEPIARLAQAVVQGFDLGAQVGALDEVETVLRADGRALASLLRQYRNGASILLLVDRLEEVCTLAPPAERELLDALLHGMLVADDPLYLLTTIRADFAGRVAEFARLGEFLNQDRAARYLLRPIEANQIVSTIVGPLHRVGVRAEAGLPQRIQAATRGEDQRLPLLGHVLRELWERRDHDQLTNDALESLGGLAGAISHSAEHVISGLSVAQVERVRDLFVALVHVGRGTRDSRQTLTRERALNLLAGGKDPSPDAEALLVRLSGGRHPTVPAAQPAPPRLLVVDVSRNASRVDLVHEVLIDRWQTLADWVEADRSLSERRVDLEAAAQVWRSTTNQAGHRKADLPTGATLDYYDGHGLLEPDRERYHRLLAPRERDYLAAARTARREQEEKAQAQAERERRRQWWLLGVWTCGALILAAATVYVSNQRGLAEANIAKATEQEALARNMGHDLARTVADAAKTRSLYEERLKLRETEAAKDPDQPDSQRELSELLSRLGELAEDAHDAEAARGFYERHLKICETQAAKYPDDNGWRREAVRALWRLGRLAKDAHDAAAAGGFYERSLKIAEKLVVENPEQTEWQRNVADSLDHLGTLAEANGDAAAARGFYERSVRILETLLTSDFDSVGDDLAFTLRRLGDLAGANSDGVAAWDFYERSMTLYARLAGPYHNYFYQRNVCYLLEIMSGRAGPDAKEGVRAKLRDCRRRLATAGRRD